METRNGTHRAFLYYFAQRACIPARHPEASRGATHASEMRYVWNNLTPKEWPWTDADRNLAEAMSSYWVNFARNGDPNGAGLPLWRAYSDAVPEVMRFGENPEMTTLPHKTALAFLDAFNSTHRKYPLDFERLELEH